MREGIPQVIIPVMYDQHQWVEKMAKLRLSPPPPLSLDIMFPLLTPEETQFLYEEIFEQSVYFRRGVSVRGGDLVVDVGANIGMFSIHAELQFPQPNSLNIIAIEPVSHNFELLRANMALYAPSAVLVQCAVGCVDDVEDSMSGDQSTYTTSTPTPTVNTSQIHYCSRFP
eukprot:gene40711-50368_t